MARELAEAVRMEEQLKAQIALKDNYFWLTQATKTKDEQDPLNPYKPFPEKLYLRLLFEYLNQEPNPVKYIKKSRTMICSWAVSGWTGHFGFTHPATCVAFQSRDERRALKCVEYVKTLWRNSIDPLKELWVLEKPVEKQPSHEFRLKNDSKFLALTGDPDNIRSEHPTIVVLDEAAFMERGEESYNTALATQSLHMIVLSSANPGWFEEVIERALPVRWPTYVQ
jgi:hypothetical protein